MLVELDFLHLVADLKGVIFCREARLNDVSVIEAGAFDGLSSLTTLFVDPVSVWRLHEGQAIVEPL
jgi:hypothetical protein